jgi:cytochrome c biogenesis protein CcdA/glutaredoxin
MNMYKKSLLSFLTLLAAAFVSLGFVVNVSAQSISQQDNSEKTVIYFHGDGCPHCANVDEWFEQENIFESYPVDDREVYNNRDNALYYNEVLSSLGVPLSERGVPALVVGDKLIVGDKPIIDNFYSEVNSYLSINNDNNNKSNEKGEESKTEAVKPNESDDNLSIWIIIGASIVDAINPCAFAVLIILLTAILLKHDKKTALASGLSFSLSIFISYVLMGLGLYGAINAAGIADLVTGIVGVIAIVIGLLNLKDYFWYGKIILVEVPRSWRPKMIGLINRTTSPIGAFFVGFLVSLFLLPCTSGPYIVVLGLLAQNPLDATAIFYLVLYNIIFVLPMIIITLGAYKGLDVEKLENKRKNNLKNLHLIAGIILLALGIYVLLS